jgi:glycosyltransferase involved in cell wall biosynthesis
MTTVNIVTSDRGWILEKLATEIADRLPYVTFGDGRNPRASIQYYVTYSCRGARLSPIEVAYFAHLEPEGPAHDQFFQVAREVEHCVCHARLYEAVLRDAGIDQVSTISPGVDTEAFHPKLRIGVVGRTYHTGRKGEHLVAAVQDIPEIEWSFTGTGWPGPALELPAADLPAYYRSLDYVLVPALYEGGPMCVVEALASGTEVIAPAIGWVPEFPHIEFKVGDVEDLRRLLLDLVAKKRALRASVMDRTWDAWAEGHDRVFQALARQHGITLRAPESRARRGDRPRKVGLYLHGNEGKSQGGPTVRVPRLARELTLAGIEAELRIHPAARGFDDVDLVHAFNTWSPWSALDLLRRGHQAGRPLVFSPIFLDLARRDLWQEKLPELLAQAEPGAATDAALAPFMAALQARRAGDEAGAEAVPGFHAAVREMATLSDQLIFLSERERARLARIGAPVDHGTVVHNPVDAKLFAEADPSLFEREYGLRDFVLCVARIEARKNQVMLVHALRDTGLPIVLIGHTANQPYRDILEKHRTPHVTVIDRLPPNSPLLASAFAAARVAVLASWAEGAPLAALEGAASGANLVLSDESGESEYFGDRARYCDPGDPASIRRAVMEAYEAPLDPAGIAAQKDFIATTYSWERHRDGTEAAYARAIVAAGARATGQAERAPLLPRGLAADGRRDAGADAGPVTIIYDVTTSANHSGRWTGIARVEAALALALRADARAEIRFIAWNNKSRQFVEMPFEGIRAGKLSRLLTHYDDNPPPPLSLPEGAHYIVPGSGWMQNALYAEKVVALARLHRLRLTPIIHDIIPTKFPFWFSEGYAPVFEQNLTMLLDGADRIVAISQATRRDVEAYATRIQGLFIPDVVVLREGDEIQQILQAEDPNATVAIEKQFGRRPFVLTVGAIHQRKNHKLLYDVWLKLAERMGPRCPHLVIVGGVAWNGHDVARALRGDARLRDHVTILDGVDDLVLDWLYRNCLMTVYPSLYEGWGLPVGESLRHGKLCIAADVASVPEIAPGLVELLDPLDVAAWATKIQFYAGSHRARAAAEARIRDGYRPFGWDESAEHLLDLLVDGQDRPRPRRPYVLGAVVSFADRVAASRIRGGGWHPLERWGCWSNHVRSELVFEPAIPPTEPLVLIAEARALSFGNAPFEVRVLVNGALVAHWKLRNRDLQVLHAVVPAPPALGGGPVRIQFESDSLTPVHQVTKSDDQRLVGIGIAKVALAQLSAVKDASLYFGPRTDAPPRVALGQTYAHQDDAPIEPLLAGAWGARPGWGMVSTDLRPRLELTITEMPGRALDLDLRLRPVATAAAPLLMLALANGEEVGAWTFASDAPVTVTLHLPPALRSRSEPITIDLVAADARAPRALGLGAAEEAFGFGLIGFAARLAGTPPRRGRLAVAPGGTLLLAGGQPATEMATLRAALGLEWHAPEDAATWSFGPRSTLPLLLGTEAARDGALVTLDVEGFSPAPGAALVNLVATAGPRLLGRYAIEPGRLHAVDIPLPPQAFEADGAIDLTLSVDAALSPFIVEGSGDERPLGIRLGRVTRGALPLLRHEEVLGFGTDPATGLAAEGAGIALRGDWYAVETMGCWSRGDAGGLAILPMADEGRPWRLFVLCRTVAGTPAAPAVVEVEVKGTPLDRWAFTDDDAVVAEVRGLAERLGDTPIATLFFRRRDAISPKDAGISDDARELGLQLIATLLAGPGTSEGEARDRFAAAGLGRHRLLREDEPPPEPEPEPESHAALPDAAAAPDAPPEAAEEPQPPAVPKLNVILDLSVDGRLDASTLSGWFEAEPDGRWSHAEAAGIRLPRPPELGRTVTVELFGRVFGTQLTGPATVELRLDGVAAAELHFGNDDFTRQTVEIDCAPLSEDGAEVTLELRRLGALSPAEAGLGDDDRKLGVMVHMLGVTWR